MTTKIFILIPLSAFMLFPVILFAQEPVPQGIIYSYDASGNRIHRAPTTSERKAAPGAEEKKETAVVTKNNLRASFTPNPTVTGNFAVVVNKKDFSVSTQNAPSEKPQIFVYNPLGELIHQESAPYDEQVNINLSNQSRGIYLVKIQGGEEMLLQRMVYE